MLSPNHLYQGLYEKVMTDVVRIVEDHLLFDWAISIEHTDKLIYLNTKWEKWGETFYRINKSSFVIDEIIACHNNNPLNAIRLYAERFTPVSHLCLLISEGSNSRIRTD